MSGFRIFRGWGLLAVALMALSGCNRDWDGARAAAGGLQGIEAGVAGTASGGQAGAGTVLRSGVSGTHAAMPPGNRLSFAALPDRGDLVGYPQQRVVRRQGAYTWHRADISEAHALRAIVDGVLRITTPGGQLLSFEYERHVEHPSGDWTWVGRLLDAPPGREAIITFGAEAVFGSIGQSAAALPLRLTMRDGASWLVETDPALQAGVEGRVLRPEAPDFLIPPAIVSGQGVSTASAEIVSAAGAGVESSSATTSASTTVVDVVIGYTPGFVTARGGASAAMTRINNIVEYTNQGYLNSQVDARVRLVHAMQVSYPDATDNGDALEKLTGYKSGIGYTTPDPAFDALRTARETYGADLVTLVRKFNDPENDGCGIAWLIGGGQTSISQGHQYFGYSVVSDGQDQGSDGKTYYCRDETLAHELAHNMGSAHDIETAKGDDGILQSNEYGRYPYSFGYKTGPGSGDFFTIMAYSDKRNAPPYQTPYRVFSNPRTTYCGGYPCGTSSADNARSLEQTIPIIATFRATVVPLPGAAMIRNDVNGDGKSDLLWRNTNGRLAYWLMSGTTATYKSPSYAQSIDYRMAATGDFNGDGLGGDLAWLSASQIVLWTSTGMGFISSTVGAAPADWTILGAGDIDGDGVSDLLWRNMSSGNFAYWLMSGSVPRYKSPSTAVTLSYKLVAITDLNGDGRADLVWDNNLSVWAWLASGSTFLQQRIADHPAGWAIVGAGDTDIDGKSDLFWRNASTGNVSTWLMNGAVIRARLSSAPLSTAYELIASGDFNGDGRIDLAWGTNTDYIFWLGNTSGFSASGSFSFPTDWRIVDAMGQ